MPIIDNITFATSLCPELLPHVRNVNNRHFYIHHRVVLPLIIMHGVLWLKRKSSSSLLKPPTTLKLDSAMLTLIISIPIIIFIIITYWQHCLNSILMIPNLKLHAQFMIVLSAPKFQEYTINISYKALFNSPLLYKVSSSLTKKPLSKS